MTIVILDLKLREALDKEIAKQSKFKKKCVYCGKQLRSYNKSYLCTAHYIKHKNRLRSIKNIQKKIDKYLSFK